MSRHSWIEDRETFTGPCVSRRAPSAPDTLRSLAADALRRYGYLLAYGALVVLAALALWQGLRLLHELDALRAEKAARAAAPALPTPLTVTFPPDGLRDRLVWGPPMTVVIRGEAWTVRTVMEEATR